MYRRHTVHREINGELKSQSRVTAVLLIQRLRVTFISNSKREFVPRDQVFPLIVVYCLLLLHKNK